MDSRKVFLAVLAGTLLLKVLLAAAAPLSAEEAYFYLYGLYPALGYYDHPPMVGWLLHPVLYLGRSEILLRTPAILASTLVGPGIYLMLRRLDETRAFLIGTLYLISPLHILFVPVSADAPLALFSFLSALFLFKGLIGKRTLCYAASGIFLGAAFLSRHQAVLLCLSYLLYFLLSRRNAVPTRGFAVLFLSALPFVALNLYWNYRHGWPNVMLHLNASRFAMSSPGTALVNALIPLYLATPPLIALLVRNGKRILRGALRCRLRLFAFLYAVPLAAFLAIPAAWFVGLPRAAAFSPFLYVLFFLAPENRDLVRAVKGMGLFTLVHLTILAALLSIPPGGLKGTGFHEDAVLLKEGRLVAEALRPFETSYRFASPGYGRSAILTYHTGKYVFVFGRGADDGRQDDLLTDMRHLSGEDVLVFAEGAVRPADYAPYFASVTVARISVDGLEFPIVLGRGFNYDGYRDRVLRDVRERFYSLPSWLPRGGNPFGEKYFGEPLS